KGQTRQLALLAGRKGDGHAAFADQAKMLVASAGGQVGVWEVEPFRVRKQWAAPLIVNALAVSDDGSRLATLDVMKAAVSVFDPDSGAETQRLSAGVRLSRGLALSPDGGTVAVGCLLRPRGQWVVQL